MSVSAVAPTPFYHDPDRLPIGMPETRADNKPAGQEKRLGMFAEGDDSPSFWDVLDVINPLQHIPIVNSLYRELTGDKIGVGARMVGGTLFGGPIGLAAAAINAVVEESSGKDMGGHVLALFKNDAPATDAPATQFAAAPPASTPAASTPAASAPAVSSSPAKAEAAEVAAPVITLPDSVPASGPMMSFGLGGVAAAPQATVTQTPLGPPPAAAQAAAPAVLAKAEAAPVQLGPKPARLMPVPGRNNTNPEPLAPITVPVSNSSSRSNVPITGRAPSQALGASATKVFAGQEVPANHPMVPPTGEAGAQTAANPDWFSAAWGQAMDKYQRAGQAKPQPSTSTLQ